jgi:hypothetical protein
MILHHCHQRNSCRIKGDGVDVSKKERVCHQLRGYHPKASYPLHRILDDPGRTKTLDPGYR